MKVIEARNPHEALIKGVYELQMFGVPRDSRNGPVLVMPTPVTTVYEKPEERVIFWPERDANPFFHLYESLWMLAGRERVEPLLRYVKKMADYADDGRIHGAYGARWRHAFHIDQLRVIAERLKKDPNDRRSVLQMWDAKKDLDKPFKDVPCNTIASVQINGEGALDITVFCRSNDIIWGAYGANAVQFATVQEYLARSIGCPMGRYYQVSVNWHAYRDVFDKLYNDIQRRRPFESKTTDYANYVAIHNPYSKGIRPTLLPQASQGVLDMMIRFLLDVVDNGFTVPMPEKISPWEEVVYAVLRSHHIYKTTKDAQQAIDSLHPLDDEGWDWVIAAKEWFGRRMEKLDITTHRDKEPQFIVVQKADEDNQ